jgi:hypothetical protein
MLVIIGGNCERIRCHNVVIFLYVLLYTDIKSSWSLNISSSLFGLTREELQEGDGSEFEPGTVQQQPDTTIKPRSTRRGLTYLKRPKLFCGRTIRLHARPPSPASDLDRRHTGRLRKRGNLLIGERKGAGVEPNHTTSRNLVPL